MKTKAYSSLLMNIKRTLSQFIRKKGKKSPQLASRNRLRIPLPNVRARLVVPAFALFCLLILSLSIRGLPGAPTPKELNQSKWHDTGPLELSPERGRYALIYSLVENKSFFFTKELADFSEPDIGYANGKYVSLFAPGVSFLAMPTYMIGRAFGIPQVGAFFTAALFAVINGLLLRAIAIRLGAHPIAASVGAIAFVFASPAFAYAVTLYQHHISTFLILMSAYILLRWNNLLSLAAIWFLCAAAIPIDYPNLFFMLPIGFFALGRLFVVKNDKKKLSVKIKFLGLGTFLAALLPLLFFCWFNYNSSGNAFQLTGTLKTVKQAEFEERIRTNTLTKEEKKLVHDTNYLEYNKSAVGFFSSRRMINGLYEHITSVDRGLIVFTPVMLFSIFGIIYSLTSKKPLIAVLIAIIGFNILLYSMWGDPYGGWAFGSRYLIPSYAILSIFLGVFLTRHRKNLLILVLFFIILCYSLGVNTLGALTSNQNPPKVEAVGLGRITHRVEKYTYERNIDFLKDAGTKSYAYHVYFNKLLSPVQYYMVILASICGVSGVLLLLLRRERSLQ